MGAIASHQPMTGAKSDSLVLENDLQKRCHSCGQAQWK
jgi:hypothetical protein